MDIPNISMLAETFLKLAIIVFPEDFSIFTVTAVELTFFPSIPEPSGFVNTTSWNRAGGLASHEQVI